MRTPTTVQSRNGHTTDYHFVNLSTFSWRVTKLGPRCPGHSTSPLMSISDETLDEYLERRNRMRTVEETAMTMRISFALASGFILSSSCPRLHDGACM